MNRHQFYFILSGNNEKLSLAELKALLETYSDFKSTELKCYSKICLANTSNEVLSTIIRRAGYITEAGILIDIDDPYSPSYEYIDELKKYDFKSIRSTIVRSTIELNTRDRYIDYLKEKLGLIHEYTKTNYLRIIFSEGLVFIGYPLASLNKVDILKREPKYRPFFRSIALPVRLSRALINLSRVKENQVILDPFMGTGSIVLEAALMGIRAIGAELDWELVHGALENIRYYGAKNTMIILGDSTTISYNEVDGIATDPPYGRAASTKGRETLELYKLFLERAMDSLKKGGYLVFMAPLDIEDHIYEFICRYGFIIRDEIYMYVHGGLTRTIFVAYKP
ncbi:MAG: RNA methyltransferase [Staphylothermus sp.]|nr:RNA methyltransferase [Staphylothermus sp.]